MNMNKPVNLRLSILKLSKILIHEFLHNYVRPKYGKKAKLCCMDTNSFIEYIKTNDIYKDIQSSNDDKRMQSIDSIETKQSSSKWKRRD